ncbi:hypothetical protein HBB16_01140 [Pseudonocardia sp. MCCB 268]|nr:hypothetical protein [Pseudonocardia cytotoxica]
MTVGTGGRAGRAWGPGSCSVQSRSDGSGPDPDAVAAGPPLRLLIAGAVARTASSSPRRTAWREPPHQGTRHHRPQGRGDRPGACRPHRRIVPGPPGHAQSQSPARG